MIALLVLAPLMAQCTEPAERLHEAAAAFSEIVAAPDTSIPEDLLAKSHRIAIAPGLKTGAVIVGGKFEVRQGLLGRDRRSSTMLRPALDDYDVADDDGYFSETFTRR